MTVNDQDISLYGARLQDFSCGAPKVTNEYYLGRKSFRPQLLNTEPTVRPLSVTLEFAGADWNQTVRRISAFTALVSGRSEIYLPDEFWYSAVFKSATEPEVVLVTKQYVTYTFDAIRHGSLVTKTMTDSVIHCISDTETGCQIKITPLANADSITVSGITIHNVTKDRIILIDGIGKRVTEDGVNKFAETNLIEFPVLKPGQNQLTIPTAGAATVEISYYPIYL